MRAKFVAMGTGPLHRPKLPGIPGIETFQGHSFHTSRWDYAYTGGDPAGAPMDQLADKRVGIIGTGATAVQCVPHLAQACGELFVFQRTPSSIDIRNNVATDPAWFATLEAGWQQKWLENFTILQTGGFADDDFVMDGWTDHQQAHPRQAVRRSQPRVHARGVSAGLPRERRREDDADPGRVDEIIADPDTAEALKPWYRQLCKRPCFHDQYLQAFNNPNTPLVDTDGKGVERIDETGVWASGEHYELDCVIYASGFEVGTEFERRSGYDTVGRDGLKLSEKWADGMMTPARHARARLPERLRRATDAGRQPDLEHPSQPRRGRGHDRQDHQPCARGRRRRGRGDRRGRAGWVDKLEHGGRTFGADPDCTPGYYNNEGQPTGRQGLLGRLGYPEGPVAYFKYIDEWRNSGDFEGLTFR